MRLRRNGLAAVIVLILLGSLPWGRFAGSLRASPPDASANRSAPGVISTFTKAYALVEKNFATPVSGQYK